MKKILYGLVGFVIIAVLVVVFFADSIGKDYAQKYAQNLLKTPVKISQLESSFFDKNLKIDFVEVQNPPNFKK